MLSLTLVPQAGTDTVRDAMYIGLAPEGSLPGGQWRALVLAY